MKETDLTAAGSGKTLAGAVIIAAVCFLAYKPAIYGDFVWDDDRYVTNNELLAAPDGLWHIWFTTDSPSQYFPLTYTSFRIEYALWGLNPTGYHIINIVLHIANALLLWILLRQLAIPGAWLAAMIFALHPVHVESVAWISERKNVLMVFCSLLSLLAWVRFVERSQDVRPNRHFYILSLLFYVLALAAKSTACTLPVALLAVLWLKNAAVNWKRRLQIIPYLLLGLAAGLLAVWWENHHQGTEFARLDINLVERFLIAGHALWFYTGKFFWPLNLTFSYPQWKIDLSDILQYGWLAACLAAAVILWYWRRKLGKGAIAAIVFFVGTLLPVIGFISLYTFVYTYVADHYQYFASIGPIALVTAIGYRAASKLGERGRNIAKIIAGLMLMTLGTLTWRQCHAYKNMESLWRDTLDKNPTSWMAYNNLGQIYAVQGKTDDAINYFQKSLEIAPGKAWTHYNLALALKGKGIIDESIEQFQQTLRIDPSDAEARYELADLLESQGKISGAVEQLNQALKTDPDYLDALNHLTWILAAYPDPNVRDPHRAIALALRADKLIASQDPSVLRILAAAYAANGQRELAIQTAQKALDLASAAHSDELVNLIRSQLEAYQNARP